MTDEALWAELMAVARDHLDADEAPDPATAYRRVARCVSICHRLGVEHPGVGLLSQESFEQAELDEFFKKAWRLAVVQEEQARIDSLEVRRGVDNDAADFTALRDQLAEARRLILDFGWLPQEAKRRQLDRLEACVTDLQRARDDFDVALADVRDPDAARTITIGRPRPWPDFLSRVAAFLGPNRVERQSDQRALAAPSDRDR